MKRIWTDHIARLKSKIEHWENKLKLIIQTDRGLLHISLREAILIAGQHYNTSMNDRLEKGRGTGIIRIEPTTRHGVT